MANTYLTKTPGTSTNNNKFTMSVWVKRTKITGDYQAIYTSRISGGAGAGLGLFIGNDDSVWYNSGTSSSAFQNTSTSAKLRDLSGWYNIVVAGDTTQSGTDKLKIWINNVQQTSFGNDNRSSFAGLSYDLGSATYANQLGRKHDGTYYLDAVLSHFHFIDGTTYTPSTFGSTDATTGEWKINTSPSVTYGNNGFFMFKDDNSLNDDSGNGNNFASGGGTLSKTEDCPSNVFATLNGLMNYTSSTITFSNGNTKATYPGAWIANQGTIGAITGKYYWEAKVVSGNNQNLFYGICRPSIDLDSSPQNQTGVICQHINGDRYLDGSYSSGAAQALVNGDILGVALDLDSGTKTVKFYKNGSLLSSGSSINLTSTYDNEFVLPFFAGNSSSASSIWETNFGNGIFGTTTISSAGTNASNNGIFEYNVPTGYTALSTKGLNL